MITEGSVTQVDIDGGQFRLDGERHGLSIDHAFGKGKFDLFFSLQGPVGAEDRSFFKNDNYPHVIYDHRLFNFFYPKIIVDFLKQSSWNIRLQVLLCWWKERKSNAQINPPSSLIRCPQSIRSG
jgi:hypothetical protein